MKPSIERVRPWSRMVRTAVLDLTIIGLFLGLGPGTGTGFGPPDARAQTPPASKDPTAEDKMQAKVYFERGEALKQSGRARADSGDMDGARAAYSEAAGLYLRAFRLFPHPAFVFNAAQMHRLSGETKAAIAAYERYLEIDAEGAKAQEARTHLTQLRRSLAARSGATQDAARRADRAEAGDEDSEGEETGEAGEETTDEEGEEGEDAEDGDADGPEDEDADGDDLEEADGEDAAAEGDVAAATTESGELGALDELDADEEPAQSGRPLRIAGLATLAVGAIGFGVGVKYGLDAQSIADDLSQPRSMWTPEDAKLFDDGERADRNAIIFMSIGGAALVTGGVLYLVGHNRDSDAADTKSLGVSASGTSDGASMLLWGRF